MSSRIKACIYDTHGNLFCCGAPKLVAKIFIRNLSSISVAEAFENAWVDGKELMYAQRLKKAIDKANSLTSKPWRFRIVRQKKGTTITQKISAVAKKVVPQAAVEDFNADHAAFRRAVYGRVIRAAEIDIE